MNEGPSGTIIRRVVPADAGTIAKVHVRSWQQTYRGQVPDDYLDGLGSDVERRTEAWTKTITDDKEWTVLAAGVDGALVGFASVGPDREDGARGELGTTYLLQEHWGAGIGFGLHQFAMEELRHRGFRDAVLWVLDTNERTRRWYERQGWKFDGAEKKDDRETFVLNEVRYAITL